ncbi:hypothetical protein TRFO_15758 [Tritrichomonas foetus]|uniref:Uncharacterized protein n=1 Tax=Tritrichomonas foetus TaxID=1144522 RepID=A0A1J4KSX5_9EUKA|nr:hypothetical protein TRFO_15758 [Tritrichomonas foetus]|eukprot:OHT13984.1 hypothetical protein TRFO_15758 [Tritrichomonas foetus]
MNFSFDSLLNQATNIWEWTKDSVIDGVGVAADYVLGESFVNDPESKKILIRFEKLESNYKSSILKIHLLRQHLLEYTEKLTGFYSAYNQTFKYSNNSILSNQFHQNLISCKNFESFVNEISEKKIPTNIENEFEKVSKHIKSFSINKDQFIQNNLKLERTKATILATLDSSPAERIIELQKIERETKENVESSKISLTEELNQIEKELKLACDNAINKFGIYHQEIVNEMQKISQ